MTKAKEIKDVILTEREQEMIKWIANRAYESIRADFWDDEREKYFDFSLKHINDRSII